MFASGALEIRLNRPEKLSLDARCVRETSSPTFNDSITLSGRSLRIIFVAFVARVKSSVPGDTDIPGSTRRAVTIPVIGERNLPFFTLTFAISLCHFALSTFACAWDFCAAIFASILFKFASASLSALSALSRA